MTPKQDETAWSEPKATALLVLADGTVLEGIGLGAAGKAVGEVCFNTAMTGYQEILTDPSYAGQIITFTFPHIGNVGTNDEDIETVNMAATPGVRGCVLKHRHHRSVELPRDAPARPVAEGARHRRHRRHRHPRAHRLIRDKGMPNAVIAHAPRRQASTSTALKKEARALAGPGRHGPRPRSPPARASPGTRRRGNGARATAAWKRPEFHVVAIDYGIKRNILRLLADHGCRVTVRAGRRPRPRRSWRTSPTASSCRTAPAIRRRPANTPCR